MIGQSRDIMPAGNVVSVLDWRQVMEEKKSRRVVEMPKQSHGEKHEATCQSSRGALLC